MKVEERDEVMLNTLQQMEDTIMTVYSNGWEKMTLAEVANALGVMEQGMNTCLRLLKGQKPVRY